MATYKKINSKIFSKSVTEHSLDNAFWRNYDMPVLVKEFGPIDYIDFSPTEPNLFAVTCSCRVQIYNSVTKLVTKNLNKFKKSAYGASFRKDGRLLCVGGDEAVIKLFDVHTRSSLRIFAGHTAPVHRTFFTSDGMHIVSFSDDKTTALWDVSTEKQLVTFHEHNDYVRAGAVCPVSSDIYVSGSYDKTANMYDVRTGKKIFSVNHDAPVESILYLPTGGIFLTAGGTEIRVWDCLTNGRLLAKMSQHHKTITCLQMACNGRNILSASLDRHVKIYDAGTYKTVYSLDYPNAILSIGMSVDNQTIVGGMVDGMVSIRQREITAEKTPNFKKLSYRHAGEYSNTPKVNMYVQKVDSDIMAKHDMHLRKFQYSKALDCVMRNYVANKSPHITVSLLQELIRRQGLYQALAGRDRKYLFSVFKFIIRHINNIQFNRVLLSTADILLNMCENRLEELSLESQAVYHFASKKLEEEEETILILSSLKGVFEVILSAAESAKFHDKNENSALILPSQTAREDFILNV